MAQTGLRDRKKRELKDELSRFGIELFMKQGFDQTTIDEIVDPLGVSKRTFFRYFATKEDLIFAWYEELTDELLRALDQRPKEEAPYEAVCATLRTLLHYYDEDPAWARAMVSLSKQTPALVGKSFEKRALWTDALAKALQKRLPKAALRELRAEVLVSAAMAAFTHAVDEWAARDGKPGLHALVDKAFAMVREA